MGTIEDAEARLKALEDKCERLETYLFDTQLILMKILNIRSLSISNGSHSLVSQHIRYYSAIIGNEGKEYQKVFKELTELVQRLANGLP